ncbi:hypothetical protein AAGS40_29045 (plasmid) [Paraburkholderia sp. PREW-6R]
MISDTGENAPACALFRVLGKQTGELDAPERVAMAGTPLSI